MSSGSVNAEYVNVFVRVRPPTSIEHNEEKNSITTDNNKRTLRLCPNQNKEYSFEYVFDTTSTQEDVFNVTSIPVIKEVFNGYDCTILTYGQSNTGKTYTLLGPDDSDEETTLGIIQRSCDYIFDNIGRFKKKAVVRASCLGFVSEELVDMLSDSIEADVKDSMLKIYEDQLRKGSVLVEGLKEVTVHNMDDVHIVIKQALMKRRRVAKSHMIFNVVVRVRETSFNGQEYIKKGKISFFDLSFSDSNASKESGSNMSLFILRNVVTAVSAKNSHVPFRNSKLTRLLQNGINGSGKTTVIATISLGSNHLEGTLNTLDFASKMKSIQNYPRIHQLMPGNIFMNQYTDEIHRLKKNIAACKTGFGINVSEENYNAMLMNTEGLKKQLFEKTVLGRDAEEEVETKKQEVIRVENTLKKAVKEIEDLISEVQILSASYETAVQEKNEQQQELQQIKCDRNSLISNVKVLVSEINACLDTEEIIHGKIASLYEDFGKCKAALRDFRPLFEIGNLTVINDVEKCIASAGELLENISRKVRSFDCELEKTTCPHVKYAIEKLHIFCSVVLEHVADYTAVKNSYAKKEIDFPDDFIKDIEDSLATINLSMFEDNSELLRRLDKEIELIEVSWADLCATLLDTFRNVELTAGYFIEDLHETIDRAQESVLARHKQIEDAVQSQFNIIVSVMETKKTMDQEMENDLSAILIASSECEEYYSAKWNEIESNLSEAENVARVLRRCHKDLFETGNESMGETLQAIAKQYANLKRKIDRRLKKFTDFKNREDCFLQDAQKNLESIVKGSERDCQKFDDSLRDSKLSLSNLMESFIKNEEEENLRFNKVDDVCKNVSNLCRSATDTSEDLCNRAETVRTTSKRNFDDTSSKLPKMRADFHQCGSQAEKVVNKFCRQELQHPNHNGDTPRRAQKVRLNMSGIKPLNIENNDE